jgi:hypothetical protein
MKNVMALMLALGASMGTVAAQERIIDDFTTGPTGANPVTTTATGIEFGTQAGDPDHLLGGTRCLLLWVTGNNFARRASMEVQDGPSGYAVVDTGVGVNHQGIFLYGFDAGCNAAPMHADLSAFAGLRLDFEALDLNTSGAVVVWTGGGNTSVPLSVGAGAPTSIYLPFDGFPGPVDWSDVLHIGLGIQTGGFVAAHDYVLKSIKAVTP